MPKTPGVLHATRPDGPYFIFPVYPREHIQRSIATAMRLPDGNTLHVSKNRVYVALPVTEQGRYDARRQPVMLNPGEGGYLHQLPQNNTPDKLAHLREMMAQDLKQNGHRLSQWDREVQEAFVRSQ